LYREFAAARRRLVDEENARITQAWHVVRIYAKAVHDKRVPKLQSLLLDVSSTSQQQTPDEMKAVMRAIGMKQVRRG